jgi:tRNA(fMet)-specific endonuclease VapC
MRILIDSNAYTQLKRGHAAVGELVRRSEAVLVSTIVAGELLYGFRHGSRYERNRSDFQLFLDNPYVDVVPVSPTTADRYSRVAASLRSKGRPIPTNDIWIAAHAMETGAELVSFDQHFELVDGLAWLHLSAES